MSKRKSSGRARMRWAAGLALCLPMSWAAATQTSVYQWHEADGVRAFSWLPPPDGSAHYTHREIYTPTMGAATQAQVRARLARDQALITGEMTPPNMDLAVALATDILARARDAQALGRAPLPDERVHDAHGGSRLSPQYFARQQRLDTAVALAQADLDNAVRTSAQPASSGQRP